MTWFIETWKTILTEAPEYGYPAILLFILITGYCIRRLTT